MSFREADIIEVPIRGGKVVVRIHGIPFDFTPAEAAKVAAVVAAFANRPSPSGEGT